MTRKAVKVDEREQELAHVARVIAQHGRCITFAPDKGLGEVVEGIFTTVEEYAAAYPADGSTPARKKATNKPADPEKKRRLAEAMAYVRDYTGTWALILDIRSDRRFGTKHMTLSDRQVEVILQARDRDLERAVAREVADELFAADQYVRFTEERSHARPPAGSSQPEARPVAPQRSTGSTVAEGIYSVDGQPWKVQHTRADHSRLYAKRLVVRGPGRADWEYVPGGLSVVAQRGRPLTVEEAEAFGQLYGVCAVCGRELTAELSIQRSIGPVCYARLGGA